MPTPILTGRGSRRLGYSFNELFDPAGCLLHISGSSETGDAGNTPKGRSALKSRLITGAAHSLSARPAMDRTELLAPPELIAQMSSRDSIRASISSTMSAA